jgi:signal transduction histidine kinase
MVLMGLGIAFLTTRAQRQTSDLRKQLSQVESESFRTADQFRVLLRQLNNSLYHYGRSNIAVNLPAFGQASHELDLWIDEQKPKLATEKEKAIMHQIDGAYDGYRRTADELLAHLQAIGEVTATVDHYTAVQRESQHLFDLVEELARAHLASRDQLLSQANHALTEMRLLVLSSLGLLFLFASALGVVIYRDMIVPLRVKLVESESLRERQEKLASLGVLAAGVAHEIRNPLTAIKAALFIQQKKFQAGSQEASDAKVIDREILRLERIVNDFLLFARPSDSHLAPMTADAPLREVQTLLAPQLAKASIQLVLENAPPLRLTADAEQIKQVLINLVQNAADAIGGNGVVKLCGRSGKKIIDGKETPVAILEVEDNGKGIPLEVQKRLFDPFFTTKETGTGLGLSIAARIVHSHGGLLEYQTAPGLGTTFSIVLPLAVGNSPQRAEDSR